MENRGIFSVVGFEAKNSVAEVLPALKTDITSDIEHDILRLAENGLTPKAISKNLGVDLDSILSHIKNTQLFAKAYAQARLEGLEALADSLTDIANDEPDVLRARVKSDNIKWLLSKRKAHVYGDKLEVNMNATLDIASALDEARNRVAVASAHVIDKDLEDLLS